MNEASQILDTSEPFKIWPKKTIFDLYPFLDMAYDADKSQHDNYLLNSQIFMRKEAHHIWETYLYLHTNINEGMGFTSLFPSFETVFARFFSCHSFRKYRLPFLKIDLRQV